MSLYKYLIPNMIKQLITYKKYPKNIELHTSGEPALSLAKNTIE